jgi:alkanesulfonate monooxygenase SsuD/methylene tetrahydromethanopterin reductase-like flavin-dependent oxidoreductase (luciferase family)
VKLGVYLGWHVHPWEDLLALVRLAEQAGFEAAFVDGDVSQLERRPEADCLDGWTTSVALLAHTARIQVGSMRLVHHWNAARLAQAVATAERIAPGRLRFQISIGDWDVDARFGLPHPSAGGRVAWLSETLEALRALWRGETVTRAGRYVRLDGARVRPAPPGGRVEITIAGRRPRLLELVARHADVWDVNLPPLPERVERAAEGLAAACARSGRSPGEIARSMLLFVRSDRAREAALDEFRRLNPWFHSIPDAEAASALVLGEAPDCLAQIADLAARLDLALPVVDLSGVAAGRARSLLESLGAAK